MFSHQHFIYLIDMLYFKIFKYMFQKGLNYIFSIPLPVSFTSHYTVYLSFIYFYTTWRLFAAAKGWHHMDSLEIYSITVDGPRNLETTKFASLNSSISEQSTKQTSIKIIIHFLLTQLHFLTIYSSYCLRQFSDLRLAHWG